MATMSSPPFWAHNTHALLFACNLVQGCFTWLLLESHKVPKHSETFQWPPKTLVIFLEQTYKHHPFRWAQIWALFHGPNLLIPSLTRCTFSHSLHNSKSLRIHKSHHIATLPSNRASIHGLNTKIKAKTPHVTFFITFLGSFLWRGRLHMHPPWWKPPLLLDSGKLHTSSLLKFLVFSFMRNFFISMGSFLWWSPFVISTMRNLHLRL